MQWQSSFFASLLILASTMPPSAPQGPRPRFSNYHVPWACSVVYVDSILIGACTIFDENKVLVSVDNFNQDVTTVYGVKKKYYEVVTDILVYAGSNLMDPERLKPYTGHPDFQVKRGKSLHIVTNRHADGVNWDTNFTPYITDLSRDAVKYDHYGAAYSVGFLVLSDSFRFRSNLQPILVPSDLATKTGAYIVDHERKGVPKTDTCITYSWSNQTNKIRYHQVTYLPRSNCLDVFCMWNFTACDLFPKQSYHACFKSVTYPDVCPNARGAGLYCPSFHKSMFAILTTAPSCGQRHMPGVYTTLPVVIEIYNVLFNTHFDPDKRPKYDPLGQDQSYSQWG